MAVTGVGNVAASVTVSNRTGRFAGVETVASARASRVVAFETGESFEAATLSVAYDPARVGDESDLALYRFNRTLRTFVRLDSTVHPDEDRVTAETDHFSTFAVLSRTAWSSQFAGGLPSKWTVEEEFADLGAWATEGNVSLSGGALVVESSADGAGGGGGGVPADCDLDNATLDCDRDGLDNGAEPTHGADPLDPDTDGDTLEDGPEVDRFGTDPADPDTDGGADDGTEVFFGTDPLNPADDEAVRGFFHGGSGSTSRATRTLRLPAGAESITLQATVSGASTGVDAAGRLLVEGETRDEVVVSIAGGAERSGTVTADLSQFAGETVEVRVETHGEARLEVESVKLAVDTDGDGVTDARERAGLPTGAAGVVSTKFDDADTDNDGIPDGEEFGREVSVDGREFVRLRSHPLQVDWDDDGLTDREEVNGWSIRVARDRNSAQAAHDASRRGESIDPHTSTVEVAADPMLPATDADGLTDGRENDLGTDPESVDTDTDSIEDCRELDVGEDPTLHDFRPPTISVLAINAHNVPDRDNQTLDVYDVVYEVVYRVEAPSGVSKTVVFKNDVRRDVDHFDGPTTTGRHSSAFVFESYSQYLAEVYFAPQASVKVVDVHGNAERVVERDSCLYARLAELVPKLPGTLRLVKQAFPVSLTPLEAVGLLAGFSFGVGQSVNDVITLIHNPDQLEAFVDLAKAIYERPEILPTLVEAFVDSFQRFHNVQNPFPGPQNLLNPTEPETFTNDNSTFGRTWFGATDWRSSPSAW